MINSDSEISWLLLDHTDTLERETSGGFSMFEQKGKREIDKLPYCPICRRQIWLHAISYMQRISFTGLLIGDAAWTFGMTFVVSERFMNCWLDERLKGLKFSINPVNSTFKRKSVFIPPSKVFFLAFPEPRITRFDIASEVVYTESPFCSVCSSSEVSRINNICFEEGTVDGVDCFLPSCLPGWTVVNNHFLGFIEKHKLMNFNFIEGFKRCDDRSLIKKGHWKQQSDGHFLRDAGQTLT